MEYLILVDENDQEIGTQEKIEAHKLNQLHRAFSIYVLNTKGELMLQHRAKTKYHGGDLWTNTVCGHPRPKEDIQAAAHRRLKEEMGFDTELKKHFDLIYQVDFENGLHEHEFLHVFFGIFDGEPVMNPEEAEGYEWIDFSDLIDQLNEKPEKFTPWFRIVMEKHASQIEAAISDTIARMR